MIEFEPASFKDPAGRVFYHGQSVYRTLSDQAQQSFEASRNAGLIDALLADHLLVDVQLVPTADVQIPPDIAGGFVLQQKKLPFVSYSYEWSFEMLRDAALVTLRVMDRALAAGFILKDANAFNILFDGTLPKLVDVASIEPYREGELWAGYSQFCRSFLAPLLIAAYRDIDLQVLLRGTLGELPVQQAARLLRAGDITKPGVLKDVVLQARLERSFAQSATSVSSAVAGRRYPKALLLANVRRLLALVARLKAPRAPSEWSDYESLQHYSEQDKAAKRSFVKETLERGQFQRVVDLGCNTGEYSQLASGAAATVIAIDLDSKAIDHLYRRPSKSPGLSPAVANLLNPSPAMGWRLHERRSLLDRIRSDAFLALALIHHLRITGGVPLAEIVEQFFEIAPEGIVEWIDKDDGMVRRMLSLRPDVYDDYTWPEFESCVRRRGELIAVQQMASGRRLCHIRASRDLPRDSADPSRA